MKFYYIIWIIHYTIIMDQDALETPLDKNIQDISYVEKTLMNFKHGMWFLLVICLILGTVSIVILQSSKSAPLLILGLQGIVGVCIIVSMIKIVHYARGLKICIDNVNQVISFKTIGLFNCKCIYPNNQQYNIREIERFVYDVEQGVEPADEGNTTSYIEIKIFILLKDGSQIFFYNDRVKGCTFPLCTGIPSNISEIMNCVNGIIYRNNTSKIV